MVMIDCDEEQKFINMVYISLGVNVTLSLAVVVVNAVILYLLHINMLATSAIDDSSARFQEAIKAADFARMPIVGVILIAELVDIKYEEIVREYEKDSMERRTIVYDTFGQNTTIRKFVDQYPSFLLRSGYDGETLLLGQNTTAMKKVVEQNSDLMHSTAPTNLDTTPDDPVKHK
ncbi:hypothetical protein M3Y97_00228600 [Aphelenchoides bicaudatus]|nr:hypothetical protein M3Y97_00228600 [Aphelenchoides bicaudatus]